mmetsp:Transcript_16443/g.39034  ORF Transcript_16443/g.39034 Transcript_16443/m.39034 type:complete len:457 (-) Transcript_16443:78-1448(-)
MACGTPRRWRDYGLPRHKQEESDAGYQPTSLVHRDTDSSRLHLGLSRRSLPYELPNKNPAGRQATPKPRAHSPARQIKNNADGSSTHGKDLFRRSISSNSELRRHRFAWERGLRHSLNEPLLGARPSSKQDSAQHLPRSAQDSQQAALRPLPGPPAPNPQAEGPPREAAACAAEPPSRCRQLREYRRYSTPAESLRTPQPKRLTGFGPSMRASLGEAQLSRSTCRPPGPAPRDSAERSAEEAAKGQSASRVAEAKGSACCPRGPRQRKPSNFDRSGTAGGEQCIARIGAVSHGGMSRGTWKRENQDVFYIQVRPGAVPWTAGGPRRGPRRIPSSRMALLSAQRGAMGSARLSPSPRPLLAALFSLAGGCSSAEGARSVGPRSESAEGASPEPKSMPRHLFPGAQDDAAQPESLLSASSRLLLLAIVSLCPSHPNARLQRWTSWRQGSCPKILAAPS